jgi:hypothetical protein
MILDDDESDEADTKDKAEDTSGDPNTRRIKRDTSPHNTLTTAELAPGLAKATDTPCLEEWFDLKKGCYVYEPVSVLRSYEQ